jgi:hypothetical protein
MKKEIQEGAVHPFYQIPIGSIISYHTAFKLKGHEKISHDTIKDLKTGTATKIHVTTAKFYIMELST